MKVPDTSAGLLISKRTPRWTAAAALGASMSLGGGLAVASPPTLEGPVPSNAITAIGSTVGKQPTTTAWSVESEWETLPALSGLDDIYKIDLPASHPAQYDISERPRGISEAELAAMDLTALLSRARYEQFEAGMDSTFSRQLDAALELYGDVAVRQLGNLIFDPLITPPVAAEALRWAGRGATQGFPSSRRSIVTAGLSHVDRFVRDAAVMAIASLDDRSTIPSLKAAIAKEPVVELKADMIAVLHQLQGA